VSESLYDRLLPYWMDYQWAQRDRIKIFERDKPYPSDDLMAAAAREDETREQWHAWCRRTLGISNQQIEYTDDGSCLVSGVMLFKKY
jgi:hypothetical protein